MYSQNQSQQSSPLLIVPNHHYHAGSTSHQQVSDFFPTTTPRYDSQYSLHEDVANFLNCVRLAFLNPYTQMDDDILQTCIGFARHFPLLTDSGVTQQIWGGPVNHYNESITSSMMAQNSSSNSKNSSSNHHYTNVTDSQQKMMLWMQGLQQRIEDATTRNLDIAAAAFGPCEEARRDRGGDDGQNDVEAVRRDLEWWMQQHEELELRLKKQKEFLKKVQSDINLVASTQQQLTSGNNKRDPSSSIMNDDDHSNNKNNMNTNLRSAFNRANDLQQLFSSSSNNNNSANRYQNTINLVNDVATLSRSVSASAAAAGTLNNNNNNKSTTSSRSTSVVSNHNNRTKTVSSREVAQSLNYELLALQAATYRTESIAETREKLVNCVFSLGIQNYGEKKFPRTATHPRYL